MILNIFNLLHKYSNGNIPLEDFTTECFAGILQQHPEVLESFVEWLNLPKGKYKVHTQVKIFTEKDDNSILDILIENNEVYCIIENKVNAGENCGQLEKYIRILDAKTNIKTYLKYCTKYVDIKHYKDHQFSQYRWHELATFLKHKHRDIGLVNDFLQFLNKHQMTLDTSIRTDTVITMNKFIQTYEMLLLHLNNALPIFRNYFPKGEIIKKESLKEIEEFGRISKAIYGALNDKSNHSEILFAIHFEEVKLQTQIWISARHNMAKIALQMAKELGLKNWEDENGIGIYYDMKIYQLIGEADAENQVKNWFEDSFQNIKNFIVETPELDWDEKVQ